MSAPKKKLFDNKRSSQRAAPAAPQVPKAADPRASLDLSQICGVAGLKFVGELTTFTNTERMQRFELAVRTAVEVSQFERPDQALKRAELLMKAPPATREDLLSHLSSAHEILAQRLRNLGAKPLPSTRLNRAEQARHLQKWVAQRLAEERIASVDELFAQYFQENHGILHESYAASRHACKQQFSEVVQAYWHTALDYRSRLTAYFRDPGQPKVPVKVRTETGWEEREVGILKPCRSGLWGTSRPLSDASSGTRHAMHDSSHDSARSLLLGSTESMLLPSEVPDSEFSPRDEQYAHVHASAGSLQGRYLRPADSAASLNSAGPSMQPNSSRFVPRRPSPLRPRPRNVAPQEARLPRVVESPRFFVPLCSNGVLPIRGPEFSNVSSTPSPREDVPGGSLHLGKAGGMILRHRSARVVELIKNAWNSAWILAQNPQPEVFHGATGVAEGEEEEPVEDELSRPVMPLGEGEGAALPAAA